MGEGADVCVLYAHSQRVNGKEDAIVLCQRQHRNWYVGGGVRMERQKLFKPVVELSVGA